MTIINLINTGTYIADQCNMKFPVSSVFALGSTMALLAAAASADPVTLDFNSLATGEYGTGAVIGTDNGYIISVVTGPAYVGSTGQAGYGDSLMAYQPDNGSTAPIYQITQVGGGAFTVSSWDFMNFYTGPDSQNTQTVTGYLDGNVVGTDSFTSTNNSFEAYTNTGFAGVAVTAVDFTVFPQEYDKALDNVVVTSVGVPDTGSTVAMFGVVLAGLAVAHRKGRRTSLVA